MAPPHPDIYKPYEVAPGTWVQGRLGAHWPSDTWGAVPQADRALLIRQMKEMGVGYCTILADPSHPLANSDAIRELQAAGITPIVRLYDGSPMDTWTPALFSTMATAAKELQDRLGVTMLQVGNEPNHHDETKLAERGISREHYEASAHSNLIQALTTIRDRVGGSMKLGIPPMAPGTPEGGDYFDAFGYFQRMCQALASAEKSSGKVLADWVPTHSYADIGNENQIDTTTGGYRSPQALDYPALASRIFGRDLRALSTEGGSHPSHWQGDKDLYEIRHAIDHMQRNPFATQGLWLLWGDGWKNHALLHGGEHQDAIAFLKDRFPR